MAEVERGPRWRDTFTWPWQRVPTSGAPTRASGFASCSIRGTVPSLPRRWTAGHWRTDAEAFRFWRHLSRRGEPLVLDRASLRAASVRKVRWLEWWWVNPGCRILRCDHPDGWVEIALLHRGELDILANQLGGLPPAALDSIR